VLFVLIVIGTITPIFFLGILPILAVHFTVSKRFLRCGIELKRLESVTRSPIYAMFSETLNGVSTIRGYTAEPRFTLENLRRVDSNNRAYFYQWSANRWLGVRLSSISALVIFLSGVSIVLGREYLDAGLVGISLTWALKSSEVLTRYVRYHANMEMMIHAVERIEEYLGVEQELA
ncbi:hypothetical protein HDU67_006126, partial [Dinochytrium kinnereticum]